MISQQVTQNVEKSEGLVESNFKIKACAKAFQILSSGLYSDKITAIMRELGTNAYDAHIEANNPNPFHVHIPNNLEPFFYLRDFGTGLSHENVMTLYTTYFDSTRSESNDYAGMMGLGSKSPFSYIDNFTITSWFNQKKRIYTAFINQSGIPSVTLLTESDTTEPNGLEVRFPVNQYDIREFQNRVAKVYRYFKIQPKILGINLTITSPSYFLKKDSWGICSNSSTFYSSRSRAIMGNIAYPLTYPDSDLTPLQKAILDVGIDVYFKIGELDVAASREDLSFDNTTKQNIRNKLEEIAKELKDEITGKINACSCLWEARLLVHKLRRGEYAHLANFIQAFCSEMTWNGQKLFTNNFNWEHVDVRHLAAETVDVNGTQKPAVIDLYKIGKKGYRSEKLSLFDAYSIPITEHVKFFIKDVEKNIINRLTKFLASSSQGTYVDRDGQRIFLIKSLTTDGLKQFLQTLGMPDTTEIPLLSTLPYDPVVSTGNYSYNPKNNATILLWNGGAKAEYSENWTKTEIDLNKGGFYLPIERYQFNGCKFLTDRQYGFERLSKLMQLFPIMKIDVPAIYGVKTRELEKIQKLSNWKNFETYLIDEIKKWFATLKIEELIYYRSMLNESNSNLIHSVYNSSKDNSYEKIQLWNKWLKKIPTFFEKQPEFQPLIKKLNEIQQHTAIFENLELIKLMIKLQIPEPQSAKVIQKEIKEWMKTVVETITTQYPMLHFVDNYISDDEQQMVKDYIARLDRQEEVR